MDHFQYIGGEYHAEDVNLAALAKTVGTPFYCYSSATLVRHFEVFRQSFSLPDVMLCYAVKANNALGVLATLAKLGAGADVVSEGEIRQAMKAGIPPSRMVFSGVGKTRSEMEFALAQNIFQFNVESEPELELLSVTAKGMGKTAAIALRVNPDVTPGTHAKISTGQKESKFGIPYAAAHALYEHAATLPGIKVQGVSIHIGSQLTTLEPFAKAFARVRDMVEALRAEGHNIETVDLGGGLGIPYGKEEPPIPASYSDVAKEAMKGLDCKLIFEPGRLIVGNAGILVTRVIYVKHSGGRSFVILDAGMNDLMRPALYGAYHEILPVKQTNKQDAVLVDIVGPVCETGDIFAEQRKLPLPKAGDLMAIRSSGAYGAVMASNYNTRLMPAEIMVNGSKHAVLRKRQNYEELFERDRLPDWL